MGLELIMAHPCACNTLDDQSHYITVFRGGQKTEAALCTCFGEPPPTIIILSIYSCDYNDHSRSTNSYLGAMSDPCCMSDPQLCQKQLCSESTFSSSSASSSQGVGDSHSNRVILQWREG